MRLKRRISPLTSYSPTIPSDLLEANCIEGWPPANAFILGAKTELLQVQDELNGFDTPDLIIPEIRNYLTDLRNQLKGKPPSNQEKIHPSSRKSTLTTPKIEPTPVLDLFQRFKQILQEQKKISRQDLAQQLDQKYIAGELSQEEYAEKKNLVGEKLGEAMAKLDQIKE